MISSVRISIPALALADIQNEEAPAPARDTGTSVRITTLLVYVLARAHSSIYETACATVQGDLMGQSPRSKALTR